jgi:glucose 1-dehydrogenase
MKAIAVFPRQKKVELIDFPEPKIEADTQIKLKILDVGICGTDREICQFKYGTPPSGSDFLILGHESLGEVVEVGSGVTDLKIGDMVVTMVRRPCPHLYCQACQAGRQDFCYTGDFKERGINGLHGFMTEYIVDDQKYMLRVPANLRDIGVLTEPLTIAEKGVDAIYTIQKRLPWGGKHIATYNALVIGAGPVGLLAAHVCVTHGFNVLVYSLESATTSRAKIATTLGATYVSAQTYDLEQLRTVIPGNLDVIFDGSGASKLSFDIFPLLGYNGVFVWTGIPGRKEPIDINAGTIMRNIVLKNQSVVGSVNAGRDNFQSAIQHLEKLADKARLLPFPLIQRYAVEQYAELLLKPPAPDIFKSVIHFV